MRAIFFADKVGNAVQKRLMLPRWLRPAVSGAMLGVIAVWFPHIIGVGYETTVLALTGGLLLGQAVIFTVVKTAAVAITMGGRMGGGVFSPSLMIGALTGLAFGLIATSVLPDVSGTHTLYAFAGMGAVAAAVLGAPISTTLIVFELTGDWQIGPGGDGVRFHVHRAGLAAGGPVLLPDPAGAPRHSLRRRAAGLSAGADPRRRGDAADGR